MYYLALFLHRNLGYNIVSNWGFNLDSPARTLTISDATNTNPSIITTSTPHGLTTGDTVQVSGATGNTGINGDWLVYVINSTQVTLFASTSNGTYNSGSGTLFTGFQYATGDPGTSTGASINISGASSVYAVGIPLSVRTVSAGDVGKPLVLKSSLYPTKNSGVFKIASIDAVNNRYIVDYRSSDTPPPESGTLTWWLYEIETQVSHYSLTYQPTVSNTISSATSTAPITITTSTASPVLTTGQQIIITGATGTMGPVLNGTWNITRVTTSNNQYTLDGSDGTGLTYTANSGTAVLQGYYGDGYNATSRILLQSPHSAGWQVRICSEPGGNGNFCTVTVSVGMGGNATADFTPGGVTSYIAAFFDVIPGGVYAHTAAGGGNTGIANRYTFVGDDGGQALFMYTRSLGAGASGLLSLGIPDNEPVPNAPDTDRAFVYTGINTGSNDFSGLQIRSMQGTGDTINGNCGFSYHSGLPELVTLTSWSPLEGAHNTFNGIVANSFFYSTNAADSPFTGVGTEVMPIEVWGGVTADPSLNLPIPSAGPVPYGLNQRFMGTAPFIRNGRANFGNFALSTDNTTTLNVSGATNASPIQITTSTTNGLTTGQTVVISGVTGNTAANGTFVISVIDNTHFTLNGTTGNGTYGGGGIVNGTPHWLHLQNGIYLLWNGCSGLTP